MTLCELFHKSGTLSQTTLLQPRDLLGNLYSAATNAVAPGPALARRLETVPESGRPVWILALGKAAFPMATAALNVLRARGASPAGSLIVAPAGAITPHHSLDCVAGDHPEPGPGSLAAAGALERTVKRIPKTDEVWLLLSGGTSSLIAAPEPGLSPADLTSIYFLLLGSGLDITAMNRIRKRFSRWGGGKLARALAPARVRGYVVSDVIGDDLASIGSGPCVPDPTLAREIREQLEETGMWPRLPESARSLVLSVEAGERAETPKPGDDAFAGVSLEVIASNQIALEAAAERARELGLTPVVAKNPISGEAAPAGESLARSLLDRCARRGTETETRLCMIWGGETTVTLGEQSAGIGGRCQELALAAARALKGASEGVALLAAGTDGRDGPTDAAGAIVDGQTWQAIEGSGRRPDRDLAEHNSYPALDVAGALLRPGLTGTNVMDVVMGCCL
ncbi:MAG: glycerate kinase [Gemmatimonadales bacterium]